MKIYTRAGDAGQTGLFGGPRIRKDADRLEAYGTVDELNACLGLARAEGPAPEMDKVLERVQNELFDVGAELATLDPAGRGTLLIGPAHAEALEQAIDRFEESLPPLRQFVLPGGSRLAAALHVARTVCRRAERRIVTLINNAEEPVSPAILVYLNRLGDLLFVLARRANDEAGCGDVPWRRITASDASPDAPR